MPARRRRYRRKRKPLSKAQYKAVAKVANKQIHKMSELHTLDDQPADVGMTTSGTPVLVAFPVQGDGSNQRIGDSIYLKSLQCRYMLSNESDVDLACRVIFFQWMEPDSTL